MSSHADLILAKKFISKAQNAQSRGIVFDLSLTTFRNLMRAKKCYYTGLQLTDDGSVVCEPTRRTIDRIDHKKGYVNGNVVACSHVFNQFKNEMEKTGAIGEISFQKAVAKAFNGVNALRNNSKKVTVK